jgi:YD repeat-containing protein
MLRRSFILLGLLLAPSLGMGCGLDWTLPQAHFDGVEEHGYVAYWEKIGEADLGDGLVIPVNIGFNSHGEGSSPTLGKGWTVALLESHVIPVDENCMKVVMPDGWTFTFLRNGDTQTWRGNAGWVGETSNTVFTITAPCGWRIKFDGGKIQEIDSNKNRTLTYKYNGSLATEVDADGKPFVQVENNPSPGIQTALIIGDQTINVTLAQRPRIKTMLKQNLITGFDPSLSQLQWSDGKRESFTFGIDKSLNPSLAITHPDQTQRNILWDSESSFAISDNDWIYSKPLSDGTVTRINSKGLTESYDNNQNLGQEVIREGPVITIIYRFISGPLFDRVRKVVRVRGGATLNVYTASYDERGHVIREIDDTGKVRSYLYDHGGLLTSALLDGKPWFKCFYNKDGRLALELRADGSKREFSYAKNGALTETITNTAGLVNKLMFN